MTEIIDPAKSIKDPAKCREWVSILRQKYLINEYFRDID